ncbi:hypothetical protein Tco_1472321 [Tanacetum coccineum]
MVISDEEEELVSEDSSKQGRIEETEYANVEEEDVGVEYDFDLTEQQVTPLKAPQVEEQSQETFEVELRLFSIAEDIQDTDEELAKKFDQERKAADDIDWSKIVEQAQERQSGSMIRYHSFKKKPVTIAQSRKNIMVYLKNMANYKMKYFKGMSYDQISPIFEEEYRKVQTLFKKDSEVSKSKKKRVAEEALLQESFKKLRTAQASGSEPFHQENIRRISGLETSQRHIKDLKICLRLLTERTLILYGA